MQSNPSQQAYDRGITIFSPDGRLYQVEYAREAVSRGSPSIGVTTQEGAVLLAHREIWSPLVEEQSIEKLHKADNHIGIASAGHVADGRRLVDFARQQAQFNRLRYEERIGTETLTKTITDQMQEFTQLGGSRPFGVALLIAGIEDETPRLFEADPGGTPREWKATAIGRDHRDLQSYLEDNYSESMTLQEGIELILRALASVADEAFLPEELDLITIRSDSQQYNAHTASEIEANLSKVGLLASPGSPDHGDSP